MSSAFDPAPASSFVIASVHHRIYLRATPLFFCGLSRVSRALQSIHKPKRICMEVTKAHVLEINRITVSEVQLVYNPKVRSADRATVGSPADAYALFLAAWDHNNLHLIEEAKLLLLNRGNKVLGIVALSRGGVSGTVIDPRIVLRYALLAGATALVLAHNHPSGTLRPSRADEMITDKLKAGAQMFDILLQDHLIICAEGYYSMADEGRI